MSQVLEEVAKSPAAHLSARAPRPMAARLRATPVKLAAAGAAAIIAGALAWSFVVQPHLAGQAQAATKGQPPATTGAAKPSQAITGQAASYEHAPGGADVTVLAPPRIGGGTDPSAAGPVTSASTTPPPSTTAAAAITAAAPSAAQEARRSGLFFVGADARHPTSDSVRLTSVSTAGPVGEPPLSPQAQADYDAAYGRHVLIAPRSPFEVKAGTLIPAALLTAVDTGRPGPVVAVTTEPVFDTVTGRTMLIPQGTRLIGAQAGDSAYGEKRAFLVWKRIILPNGKSLLLEDQAAVDSDGATGVPGHADRRWLQLGGAILLSGAITTLGEVARSTDDGHAQSLIGDVGDASAIQAVQVGGRLIDRELNVQPKVLVRAGAPVQVLLTKDLVLEPVS